MLDLDAYQQFLRDKMVLAEPGGFMVPPEAINPLCKPHQRAMIQWLVQMGRAACFASSALPRQCGCIGGLPGANVKSKRNDD